MKANPNPWRNVLPSVQQENQHLRITRSRQTLMGEAGPQRVIDLPLELYREILELVAHSPRIVELSRNGPEIATLGHAGTFDQPYTSYFPLPATFARCVCRKVRDSGLKFYEKLEFITPPSGVNNVLFDFALDALFISGATVSALKRMDLHLVLRSALNSSSYVEPLLWDIVPNRQLKRLRSLAVDALIFVDLLERRPTVWLKALSQLEYLEEMIVALDPTYYSKLSNSNETNSPVFETNVLSAGVSFSELDKDVSDSYGVIRMGLNPKHPQCKVYATQGHRPCHFLHGKANFRYAYLESPCSLPNHPKEAHYLVCLGESYIRSWLRNLRSDNSDMQWDWDALLRKIKFKRVARNIPENENLRNGGTLWASFGVLGTGTGDFR